MTSIFTIVSLVLNLILSGSIVLRLLFFRQRIRKDLGPAAGSQYISIAAMLIESAMIYTVVWICSLVPTLLGNPFQNVFTPACVHVQVCSRLTMPINLYWFSSPWTLTGWRHFSNHLPSGIRKAWSDSSQEAVSTLRFASSTAGNRIRMTLVHADQGDQKNEWELRDRDIEVCIDRERVSGKQ
jgi:hypothetical protein